MATIDNDIGQRIRLVRERRGMTQKELGREIRLSGGYVSQLELGDRNIDAKVLYSIAVALRVPVDHFYPAVSAIDELSPCKVILTKFRINSKEYAVCEL